MVRNYDLLSIIMLCLGGPDGENYNGVWRMLDVLLSNETSEAEKRKILQDDYDIEMTQTMEREVSVMCNLSKGVREKGVAEGMAKGRACTGTGYLRKRDKPGQGGKRQENPPFRRETRHFQPGQTRERGPFCQITCRGERSRNHGSAIAGGRYFDPNAVLGG